MFYFSSVYFNEKWTVIVCQAGKKNNNNKKFKMLNLYINYPWTRYSYKQRYKCQTNKVFIPLILEIVYSHNPINTVKILSKTSNFLFFLNPCSRFIFVHKDNVIEDLCSNLFLITFEKDIWASNADVQMDFSAPSNKCIYVCTLLRELKIKYTNKHKREIHVITLFRTESVPHSQSRV